MKVEVEGCESSDLTARLFENERQFGRLGCGAADANGRVETGRVEISAVTTPKVKNFFGTLFFKEISDLKSSVPCHCTFGKTDL